MESKSPRSTRMNEQQAPKRSARKTSGYGKQLEEKQKVKEMYGVRERQFKRFFTMASRKREGVTGEKLLALLERRLDNTIYRLKFANTRAQARQIIVHGHIRVNGKKVSSPSYLVEIADVITLAPNVASKAVFVEQVVDKRMNMGVKVPDWLELDKNNKLGRVLREPVRSDIQAPIEEYLIVELYSK